MNQTLTRDIKLLKSQKIFVKLLLAKRLDIISTHLMEFDWEYADASYEDSQLMREAAAAGRCDLLKRTYDLKTRFPKLDPFAYLSESVRLASANGHLNVLEFLTQLVIEAGSKKNLIYDTHVWSTARELAAEGGHLHILIYLTELTKERKDLFKAEFRMDFNYALRYAAKGGHLDVLKFIVAQIEEEPKINPAQNDNEAISWAARDGHLEVVKYLVSLKPKFLFIDITEFAVRNAIVNNRLNILQYFYTLSKDDFPALNPAFAQNFGIREASEKGYLEMIRFFVDLHPSCRAINPADKKNGALIMASRNGHLEVVKYLISLRDFGWKDIDPAAEKNAPIRQARLQKREKVVEYLLSLKDKFPAID